MCSTARYAQNLSVTAPAGATIDLGKTNSDVALTFLGLIRAVTPPWKIRSRLTLFFSFLFPAKKYQHYLEQQCEV